MGISFGATAFQGRDAGALGVIAICSLFFLLLGAVPAWGAFISGKVVRESDGRPISRVTVRVYDSGWKFVTTANCNDLGEYSVKRLQNDDPLPEGRYYLQTSNNQGYIDEYYDNGSNRDLATAVEVKRSSRSVGIDFSLDVWSSISGQVVGDPDKVPLEGIRIRVFDQDWTWLGTSQTDSEGHYTVNRVKPGLYYLLTWNDRGFLDKHSGGVQVAGSGWPPTGVEAVTVPKNMEVASVNFSMRRGGTISGRVVREADGAPLREVLVTLLGEDRNAFKTAMTGDGGEYVFLGLPSGRFTLKTTNKQGYVDAYFHKAFSENDAFPIDMNAGDEKTVDLYLAFGGSVSGKVTDVLSGEGLEGVEMRLYDSRWDSVKTGYTDLKGDFSIGGLPTGAYFLRALGPEDYIDEWYDDVTNSSKAKPIGVEKGAGTPIGGLSLTVGGSVSGRVCAATEGNGLQDVYVMVRHMDGTLAGGAPTGPSGRYIVKKIPAGDYLVQTSNLQGYGDQYHGDTTDPAKATKITVMPGKQTREINFRLNR